MKHLLLIIFFLGCSNKLVIPSEPPISIGEALDAKYEITSQFNDALYPEPGENLFYRWGYFIYALSSHVILESYDVELFCSALERAKAPKGIYRRPGSKNYGSKDDYTLAIYGSYFGRVKHPCAAEWFDYLIEHNKLDHNAFFAPYYHTYMERLNGTYEPGALLDDFDLYLAARNVCSQPQDETSDKLLLFPLLRTALDSKQTKFSLDAWNYCKNRVDFDYTVDYYHCVEKPGCNAPMVRLLRGLL